MKYVQWTVVCAVLFLCFSLSIKTEAAADSNPSEQQQITDLKDSQQVSKSLLDEIKNYRDYLETETSKYQENIQKSQDSFVSMFNILISVVGLLVTVALAGFTYYFGQTRKDFKSQMEDKLKNVTNELHEEYQKRLQSKFKELENKFDSELQLFLKAKEKDINALKQTINNERTYTSSRILVTGTVAELAQMEEQELQYIEGRISEKLKTIPYKQDEIFAELKKGETDILIYNCMLDNTADGNLKTIAHFLEQEKFEIPFIIYTKYLEPSVKNQISKYALTTISNFPTSLIGNIFSLAYAFNRKVKEVSN